MKKLNLVGEELLEYKKELKVNHSSLVKQSLQLGLEQKYTAKLISQEVYLATLDDDMSNEEFKSFLLAKKEFQKDLKEMMEDYDMVALDMLGMFKQYDVYDIQKDSLPEKERIHFIQTFTLDKDFAGQYFFLDKEEDLERIFQRKGFFEKFAILRLKRVFSDWQLVEEFKENLMKIKISDVYFNRDEETYNIDIEYQVNFELCENKSLRDDVVLEVTRLYESSKHHFETMM